MGIVEEIPRTARWVLASFTRSGRAGPQALKPALISLQSSASGLGLQRPIVLGSGVVAGQIDDRAIDVRKRNYFPRVLNFRSYFRRRCASIVGLSTKLHRRRLREEGSRRRELTPKVRTKIRKGADHTTNLVHSAIAPAIGERRSFVQMKSLASGKTT